MRNSVLAVIVCAMASLSWGEGLPDGYTRVEYVESTHDQYVNTGYIPNANTTIALKFSVMDYKARNEAKDTTLAIRTTSISSAVTTTVASSPMANLGSADSERYTTIP